MSRPHIEPGSFSGATKDDPLGQHVPESIIERNKILYQKYLSYIDAMRTGATVSNDEDAWADKRFRSMVANALAEVGRYRQAANDLAVITRVFGGSS